MIPLLRALIIGASVLVAGCSALIYKIKHRKPVVEQPIVDKDLQDVIITDTENKTPSEESK
jgi:hypothetical protein